MKKTISFLLMSAFVAAAFTACEPLDPQSGNPGEGGDTETPVEPEKPVTPQKHLFTVTLALPEGVASLPDMQVTISNPEKELEYVETYKAGTLSHDFEVPSGQYDIIASGRASATLTYTGSAKADVFGKVTAEVKIEEVYKSPLIFKEVYNTSKAWKLNDTYMEIVNNSDEVQYLDQVMISSIVVNPTNPWAEINAKGLYHCYGIVAAFPGTGKEHPLQPGESVVVANDAKNWNAVNGQADLTNADWESYYPKAGQADEDFDAPNLNIVYNLENQRRFGVGFFGGVLLLTKLPEGITPEQFAADASNFMTEPNSKATQKYCMIKSEWLLDLVEIGDVDTPGKPKISLAKDDAAPVMVKGWSGQAIRRKVTKIVDGRVYYQDTNNSKEDFLNNQPLTPGVHPTEVDK